MISKTVQLNTLIDALYDGAKLCEQTLDLSLGQCTLRVRSNASKLINKLARYFTHVIGSTENPDMEIVAIERDAPDLGITYLDWKREPGKSGRKDSYFDFPRGRLVRKVRTGMVFLQSATQRIAAGPCLRCDNQVINFINAQYMNWLQHRGWLICHAAGLVHNKGSLAIAGFSGGGKSTLLLHMMENPHVNYLTNDRLFIKSHNATTLSTGIPKLPRINPGTIVHNARLQSLIPADQQEALLAMPKEKLWNLEEKYDVQIKQLYGEHRIATTVTPLTAFLVLSWQHNCGQPLNLQQVDLSERRDLLGAIMKSPGPFYQFADGCFFKDDTPFDECAYLDALEEIPVYEISGDIDFEALVQIYMNQLIG